MFLSTLFLTISLAHAIPDIQVTPMDVDFGDVDLGNSQSATVTIANVGDSDITISSIEIQQGGTDFSITSPLFLPVFFSAGGSIQVEVTFTPSADGIALATLQIGSSDPDDPITDVILAGMGIGGATTPQDQIEDVIDLLDTSVEDGTIIGIGPGKSANNRLNAFSNMLMEANSLIDAGNFAEASDQLASALKHADGQDKPKDFVAGSALPQLAQLIQDLIETLDE